MRKLILVALICALQAGLTFASDEPKSAEDVITKHLAAIGTPESRAKAKSLGVDGAASFIFVLGGGSGKSTGTMRMATEGRKSHLMVDLNTPNYTGEDVVCDGSKVKIAGFVSGKKSMLGAFLDQRPELVTEGLFGGVLSTGWPLLDLADHKAKVTFSGLKKVGDQQLIELKYEPKKTSGDIQIRLYFDPETYRHVMTTYSALIPVTSAQSINPNASRAQNGEQSLEGHQLLKETFGSFKALDGVIIPSEWTIEITNDVNATVSMKWDFGIRSAVHAPIDPAAFKLK